LGLSHWDPYAVRRGCCLELCFCNMVEWFWWDSIFISTINWFPSNSMTYNAFCGMLSLYTTTTRIIVD